MNEIIFGKEYKDGEWYIYLRKENKIFYFKDTFIFKDEAENKRQEIMSFFKSDKEG